MKNWEKYEKEIKRFGLIAKVDDDIYSCVETDCSICDFRTGKQCRLNLANWLYQEYEEPKPKLTLQEKHFLECLPTHEEHFVIRNKDGRLYILDNEPTKEVDYWDTDWAGVIELKYNMLPFVKWTDEEPWKVENLLELEVDNGND